ncbi:MAG: hypothetical protein EXR20_04645 [Bacteroidetes bacterium]|nr:hypothetical protein [Bacteroidota bacterium]
MKILNISRCLFSGIIFFLLGCGGSSDKKTVSDSSQVIAAGDTSVNTIRSESNQVGTKETKELSSYALGEWVKLNSKSKIFIDKGSYEFSITIHSEDSVRWKIESQDIIANIVIVEERTGKIIDKKSKVKTYLFQTKIFNTDVYTIRVTDNISKYMDLTVDRMSSNQKSAMQSTDFIYDTIVSKKGVKNSILVEDISLIKAVNEPRKIVLSSNVSLSGESKILVPLELPKGTIQLLYELRISGENEETAEDGQLFGKVSTSVDQYKVLGKTIFETNSTESSLTRELLNLISLPKREKVSANVYFFPDEKNARLFTDRSPKGFDYDTKNSLKNTQSMNGLIKPQKNGFVYLAFESTSTFRDTYIWLDAVAINKTPRYVILKKVPKESKSYF